MFSAFFFYFRFFPNFGIFSAYRAEKGGNSAVLLLQQSGKKNFNAFLEHHCSCLCLLKSLTRCLMKCSPERTSAMMHVHCNHFACVKEELDKEESSWWNADGSASQTTPKTTAADHITIRPEREVKGHLTIL